MVLIMHPANYLTNGCVSRIIYDQMVTYLAVGKNIKKTNFIK